VVQEAVEHGRGQDLVAQELLPGVEATVVSAITELTPGTIGELTPLGTGFSLPSPGLSDPAASVGHHLLVGAVEHGHGTRSLTATGSPQ
jgi:hypothetical protein